MAVAEIPVPREQTSLSLRCFIAERNGLTVAAVGGIEICLRQTANMHRNGGVAETAGIGGDHQLHIVIAGRTEFKLRVLQRRCSLPRKIPAPCRNTIGYRRIRQIGKCRWIAQTRYVGRKSYAWLDANYGHRDGIAGHTAIEVGNCKAVIAGRVHRQLCR